MLRLSGQHSTAPSKGAADGLREDGSAGWWTGNGLSLHSNVTVKPVSDILPVPDILSLSEWPFPDIQRSFRS